VQARERACCVGDDDGNAVIEIISAESREIGEQQAKVSMNSVRSKEDGRAL